MSLFPNIPTIFLDKVIGLLLPLFMTAAGGDMDAARHAVTSMLASYNVETEEEIRLAAEITSFGFGALEALGKSMDPDLSLNAVLRLRGSANSLHRSGHQCQRALDKLRQERRLAAAGPQAQPAAPDLPSDHSSAVEGPPSNPQAPTQPRPGFPLSRQQRRAMERAVEKAQRRQAEQIRRDATRTIRTALAPAGAMASSPPPPHESVLAA